MNIKLILAVTAALAFGPAMIVTTSASAGEYYDNDDNSYDQDHYRPNYDHQYRHNYHQHHRDYHNDYHRPRYHENYDDQDY
jgi:hypothetical protein